MSLAVGDRAPEFTLPGTGGRQVSLSETTRPPVRGSENCGATSPTPMLIRRPP